MAFEIVKALYRTEAADDLHLARILLLMSEHAGKRGKPVEGITKLAKLDFLLRYPNCLERALQAVQKSPGLARVSDFERTTIESKMVRFRYGPWDYRYRRWLALLAARNLAHVGVVGRTVNVWMTVEGKGLAEQLVKESAFEDLAARARLVAREFGNMSGTALKDFVYKTFPEIVDMRWGDAISL